MVRAKPDTQEQAASQNEQSTDAPKQAARKITPVKKVTVKTTYGDVKVKDIPEGSELYLVRIGGYARDVKDGSSNYGDWSALVGDFSAKTAAGETYVGPVAIIPGAMGDFLIEGMRAALEQNANAQMAFAVDVSVKVSARDANKYEYIVRPVLENKAETASLALLENLA